MIGEITAIFTGLKSALDFVQTVAKSGKSKPEQDLARQQQAALSDLQSKLFGIQTHYQGLEEENRALRRELEDRKKWEIEADRWQLFRAADDLFVHVLKRPEHLDLWACAHCFQNHKISFFQRPSQNNQRRVCPQCGFEISPVYLEPQIAFGSQEGRSFIDPSCN